MALAGIDKVKGIVELLLDYDSRVNTNKKGRYWYPLSMATYGVEEIMEALDSMCSFLTSMADKTKRFESKFSEYQGCKDSVFCNSGSSADLLLSYLLTNPLKPLVEPGDEVLVPVVTWPTQVWSVMMAGLKIKFVDADPVTLNINLEDLESKITSRTRAIFLVHLMGNPCNMDKITELANKHGLIILEDCCEALGSSWGGKKVGNFGLGSSFSFFFAHHMMTMEGGMISCQSEEVADDLRILRAHGWTRNIDASRFELEKYPDVDPRYAFVNWGFNLRPTEIQSGFGLCQLERLPGFNARRIEKAEEIFSYLSKYSEWIQVPQKHEHAQAAWFAIPMVLKDRCPFTRKKFMTFLEEEGVETRPLVTGSIVRHPVRNLFAEFREGSFPGADIIHNNGFYIGLTPIQTDDNFQRLIETLEKFLSRYL